MEHFTYERTWKEIENMLDKAERKQNYHEVKIPNQKWNNFVFNYNSKYVDLYINGELKVNSFGYLKGYSF